MRFGIIAAGAIAALALQDAALAQSIEEITVTARKTEENLQDVPISISAFSAEQLQDAGAINNQDVAYLTPNFSTVSQLGRRLDRPVIRGMSAPSTFGEPNASYFIDGAYVSGSISANTLGPIERVEILRGPQSAQFGRATFSGAVNYVTRRPTNDFTGEIQISDGSYDTSYLNGWASGPLVNDKLLFFVSGGASQFGGQWNNNLKDGQAQDEGVLDNPPQQGDSSSLGGTKTYQTEGKLLWLPTDSAEITFKLGYLHGDDDHYPQLIVETDELNCYVPGVDIFPDPITYPDPDDDPYYNSPGNYCGVLETGGRDIRLNIPDLYTGITSNLAANPSAPPPWWQGTEAEWDEFWTASWTSQGEKPGLRRDQYTSLLRYDQDLGEWTLTTQLAYNRSEFETAYDLDGNEQRGFQGLFHFYEDQVREDASVEVRLASPTSLPVRGSIGGYYYDFDRTERTHSYVGLAQGQLSPELVQTTENIAAFGLIEWDVVPSLRFAAEARIAKDTKTIDTPISCRQDVNSPYYDPNVPITHEVSTTAFTPRVTLTYFANDEHMVYGQVAKGNKPGNFNVTYYRPGVDGCATQEAFFENGLAFVEEEDSWNYEIGTKNAWFNRRLTANLAVFYIDWENQTVFEIIDIKRDFLFAPSSVGLNAGKSRVYGFELETAFAITDYLTGTFGYGFNDGEFVEFDSPALKDLTGNGDASGNDIPNSSRNNYIVSLSYGRPLRNDLEWFARTDYSYESEKYTSATNTEKIGDRKRWNVRTGLDNVRWRASLFVNNLLDDQTPSAIIGFPRFADNLPPNDPGNPLPNVATWPQGYQLTPTPGRIYGAEFILRFGN